MNSKERMHVAFDHKEPDRVPYFANFVVEVRNELRHLHRERLEEIAFETGLSNDDTKALGIHLGMLFDHDMILLRHGISTTYYIDVSSEEFVDAWGVVWKKAPYTAKRGVGYYWNIVGPPLADDAKVASYRPPDPADEDMSYVDRILSRYGKEKYICGTIICSTFEALRYLRGTEQAMVDLVLNRDLAGAIMDMTAAYHLRLGFRMVEKGVDMLWLADDVGAETSMLISPDTFREMVKPRLASMIQEIRRRDRDVKIAFHSDGFIEPIIDDLIDIGVQVLNPIQPECMDPAHIKRRYGDRLCLWGTVSTQATMPFGSPENVRREIRERIASCGVGGGFLLAPTHNVQLDVPLENLDAFYQAARDYGRYPVA